MAKASERLFSKDVERHASLYIFAQVIPLWQKKTNKAMQLKVRGEQGGVMFDFGFSDDTGPEEIDLFMQILGKAEKLQELRLLIEEMKQHGGSDSLIRQYVMQAEILVHELKGTEGFSKSVGTIQT